jgi:hypothetical protein
MGWGYRRGFNFGPLRLNLSKSGIGYSIGTRGFRVGQDGKGRKYSYFSIPRTGIFHRIYFSSPKAPSITQAIRQNPNTVPKTQTSPNPGAMSGGRWAMYVGGGVLLYVFIRALF